MIAACGSSPFTTSLRLQRAIDTQVPAAACAVRPPLLLHQSVKRAHRGRRSTGAVLRRGRCRSERNLIIPCPADAFLRRSQVHREHVSPQGIGSADSEPAMPSRNLAPFNHIILDHVNLRGFIRHNAELQGHLELNIPKPHLLALNETHLTRTVKELSLGGCTLVSRLDRIDWRKQGGIVLFASPELAECITLLVHASDDTHERSWHALHGDLGPVLLCVWYRPPSSGEVGSINAFEAEWTRLSAGYIGTVVVGDLNVHHTH